MTRKILLLLCLLLALSARVGFCSEATYTVTETELTRLETIFAELKSSNEAQLNALNQSKTDLQTAQAELTQYRLELEKQKTTLETLRIELTKARNALQTTRDELQKVNESLAEYGREVKRTQNRLERQRNTWAAVALIAVAV